MSHCFVNETLESPNFMICDNGGTNYVGWILIPIRKGNLGALIRQLTS